MPDDNQNVLPPEVKNLPAAADQVGSTAVSGLAASGFDNKMPTEQAYTSLVTSPASADQANNFGKGDNLNNTKTPEDIPVYPTSDDTGPTPPAPTPLPTNSGAAALELPKEGAEAPVVIKEQAQYGSASSGIATTPDQRYAAH